MSINVISTIINTHWGFHFIITQQHNIWYENVAYIFILICRCPFCRVCFAYTLNIKICIYLEYKDGVVVIIWRDPLRRAVVGFEYGDGEVAITSQGRWRTISYLQHNSSRGIFNHFWHYCIIGRCALLLFLPILEKLGYTQWNGYYHHVAHDVLIHFHI